MNLRNFILISAVLLLAIVHPAIAVSVAECAEYPVETLALLAAIPIICICVAVVILWHYATKSAEYLFDKILNIGVALIMDAVIVGVGLRLFFALSCHAIF